MNRDWKSARLAFVVGTLVLIAGTSVLAQNRGGRGGFGGRPRGPGGRGIDETSLLRAAPVIDELAVSEDQQDKIRSLMEEAREKSRELFAGFRDLSDTERREMRGKFQEVATQTRENVIKILTDVQKKRLGEILIQVRGAHSLQDDKIAESLGLSKEQRQNIDDLVQAEREEQRERFSQIRDIPREERREKMGELRAEGEKTRVATAGMLLAELNESQAGQFKGMGGEPIKFDREELFRGRFAGRGPEGRRPDGDRARGGRRNRGERGGRNRGEGRRGRSRTE